ncbi:MAG TPA: bifunctional metallophosphatase/5'-nucleotidase, partial [Polyangiales bacterium]
MIKQWSKIGLLCIGGLALTDSPALAHEHAEDCAHAVEGELSEVVRKLAEAARVAWKRIDVPRERTVKLQVLGINDFHGRLAQGLLVANRPVGGAAVLASYLRAESAAFDGTSLIVHAGDHVGATPPNSALLQDEPAIEVLNLLANRYCGKGLLSAPRCNVVGTLGNHEFDEGVDELLRLIGGGNHAKGPFLESRWRGARFPYVSANVIDAESGDTLLPPYSIHDVQGERVAVIGAVLEATPTIVTPQGVAGVRFVDEADAINAVVSKLTKRGIHAFIVTIHQGGSQPSFTGSTGSGSAAPSGAILEILTRLSSEVDVVVSGHTHSFTNALVNNAQGHPILVTQAFSNGTAFDDIELVIDRRSGDVVEKSARIVTTYADEGPGLTPAQDVASLVAAADARVAPQVERVVGEAASAINRAQSAAGESALGNLIADAQRSAMGTDFAFMNPGGIRADLDQGPITWGELFTIQPFSNDLV